MYLIQGIVLLLLSLSVQSRSIRAFVNETSEEIGKPEGDFTIIHGDIAVFTGLQNADPCTSNKCMWIRNIRDMMVYVPYVISSQYSPPEIDVIQRAMDSFQKSTCIRFVPRRKEVNYINIISDKGCYSYVGRINGKQVLSLNRNGCMYHKVVQHELLHALGFHHEQCRIDRDKHVRILTQNIRNDGINNFVKVATNNLNTPYDYNSIMHYSRYAFSKNSYPTILPTPDKYVSIGRATEMSHNDILRVNRLYCS
ncbi:nephrosin isoform 2 precursor [Silurus asotus]|uniref:Metalloendopeptidase n=1 Tax=Silurus asotus TaxID=30991 RepID=A0AAD5FHD4_SILAS|nr:nephrosin isoform 2 precursor [Silurus asotus]